ncbi:M43 family zinc metalloprotease [Chondrinema litorale]|uniref:M43 family zinc metalloprotease n=1 Tax=Chondrinema litorale TaxID=2994555 RepID=UPI002543AEF0|nr:M43 family zinc metalloprotease [Chondrinema litorale]UZR98502.1 M43 family zinc metalloprotease [Chondrinema litorale]
MILQKTAQNALTILLFISLFSCETKPKEKIELNPTPEQKVFEINVVVHIIHNGEAIGTGPNLSVERIAKQIESLNNDFRRKTGTKGFNSNPISDDARIQFKLAQTDPEGNPTNGIVRINSKEVNNPLEAWGFDYFANFNYWDYKKYVNIWTAPLPESGIDVYLGEATGPDTDLPGNELFTGGEPFYAEGIIINHAHFGESDIESDYNLGRTLTHEMGHYLGLLHPWGSKDCDNNDYCDDTPAVDTFVSGCTSFKGCNQEDVLIENYMNWTSDICMNTFTKNQIERMRYVLTHSRKSLVDFKK